MLKQVVSPALTRPDLLTYGNKNKMSIAVSIRARVTFLNLEYMHVAEALPSSLRIHGKRHRYIHKTAIDKWLPPEMIERR